MLYQEVNFHYAKLSCQLLEMNLLLIIGTCFFHYVLFLIKRWVCVMNKLSKINYFFVKSSQNSSYFILVEPLSKSKVRFLMRIMWTFMVFGLITLYFCCNFLKTELWVEGWDWICIVRAAERTIRGFWNYLVTGFLGNKHVLWIDHLKNRSKRVFW